MKNQVRPDVLQTYAQGSLDADHSEELFEASLLVERFERIRERGATFEALLYLEMTKQNGILTTMNEGRLNQMYAIARGDKESLHTILNRLETSGPLFGAPDPEWPNLIISDKLKELSSPIRNSRDLARLQLALCKNSPEWASGSLTILIRSHLYDLADALILCGVKPPSTDPDNNIPAHKRHRYYSDTGRTSVFSQYGTLQRFLVRKYIDRNRYYRSHPRHDHGHYYYDDEALENASTSNFDNLLPNNVANLNIA